MNRLNFHNFKLLATLSVMFILSLASIPFSSVAQATAQERKYEVRTFRNMPVAIHEVRNLQKAEGWLRDMEIVVKNISDKPIYYIRFNVLFPDMSPRVGSPWNSKVGFTLRYGASRLGLLWNLASPEDVAIKPGESHLFTIPEGYVKGFESMKRDGSLRPEQTNKIKIRFQTISFGNGTGFEGGGTGGLRDYRGKRLSDIKSDNQSKICPQTLQEGQSLKIDLKSNMSSTSAVSGTCNGVACGNWVLDDDGPQCGDCGRSFIATQITNYPQPCCTRLDYIQWTCGDIQCVEHGLDDENECCPGPRTCPTQT
ncbi:MAG: hypothetical protein WCF57_14725 [Pyrinomonadaceae bacterium]